ncbi:C-C motif chemokine 25 isoform X2 [Otolemur garnettii]|uniref:C-C motif chemokine 25 isoform X2 n=1 Tax=Otolemur garnettii TaxID=30611 RepID=UPI00064425B0|nr:C-C motif chemokine 25 isoform X2 [Otolemur garnettii]
MNPWLLACLVACFVGAWAPGIHAQGVFEDCCLAYHPRPAWAVLRRARGYQHQEVSGSCNLPAVIFYFPKRHRLVCGNPQTKEVQRAIKFLDARKKTHPKLHHNTQMTLQGSQAGKKRSSGNSRLPLFKISDLSGKRIASFPTVANPRP